MGERREEKANERGTKGREAPVLFFVGISCLFVLRLSFFNNG